MASLFITHRIVSVDKPKPKPPTSCGDNKDKHDCLHLAAQEGDCAWCEGDYMPASCVGVKAAQYIPETVAKCKLPKKQQQAVATVEVSCSLCCNSYMPLCMAWVLDLEQQPAC